MTIAPPKLWLEQSRADLSAAQSNGAGILECHRRYWLQQAYEKAIKALMLAKLDGPDRRNPQVLLIVRDVLLRSHTPLQDLPSEETREQMRERLEKQYPGQWQRGVKVVYLLVREIKQFIVSQTARGVLERIDDTRPSISADVPSYRYPFFEGDSAITPARWQGWTAYQGDEAAVVAALTELTAAVGKALPLSGRNRTKNAAANPRRR